METITLVLAYRREALLLSTLQAPHAQQGFLLDAPALCPLGLQNFQENQ